MLSTMGKESGDFLEEDEEVVAEVLDEEEEEEEEEVEDELLEFSSLICAISAVLLSSDGVDRM